MPIESLINSGKPLEAWEAIQGLPPRLRFTTQTMRQRLRCATLLGWSRRAEMLEAVMSSAPQAVFAFPDDNPAPFRMPSEAAQKQHARNETFHCALSTAH